MNRALKDTRSFLLSYEVSGRSQLTSPKSTKWILVKYLLDDTVFFRKSICHKNVHFKIQSSWNGAFLPVPPDGSVPLWGLCVLCSIKAISVLRVRPII